MKKYFKQLFKGLSNYKPLISNSGFMKLLFAGIISEFGSKISYFTLLSKVYSISGGKITNMGFLTIAQILPRIFFAPVAGVVCDKFSRKKIMILSDLFNGLIILNMIWIQDLRFIYLTSFCAALVNTFRNPAQSAMEPNLVEKDQIVLLNSFKASSRSLVQIVGTAVGGMTVGFLGVNRAFTVDTITFLTSALIILTITVQEVHLKKRVGQKEPISISKTLQENWHDFSDGFHVVWGKTNIRMVFLISMFMSFAMGMQGVLIYSFLKQTLQLGDQAEKVWGFLLSSLGVGSLVGSIILGMVIQRYPNRFKVFLNILLFDSIVFILFLTCRYLPLSYVLFGALGAIGAASGVITDSMIQEEVTDENRGKVFSLLGMLTSPVSALSIFIGTTAASVITALNVLLISASSEAIIAIGLRFTKTYRQADHESVHLTQAVE